MGMAEGVARAPARSVLCRSDCGYRMGEIVKKAGIKELRELEGLAQASAGIFGPVFDSQKLGFALIGFTFGEAGVTTYVTNADKSDLARLLREMAEKIENGEDLPPVQSGEPSAH